MKKYCYKCEQMKLTECFSWKNKSKNILQHMCKNCVKLYSHIHYLKNKDVVIKRTAKHTKKRIEYVKEYKRQHPCIICGYNKCIAALDFHHKNNFKKEFLISTSIGLYGYLN